MFSFGSVFAIGIGTILIFFPFLHFLQLRSTWEITISYPVGKHDDNAEKYKT